MSDTGERPEAKSPVRRRLRAAAAKRVLWIIAIAALAGGVAYYRSRPPRIETVTPILENVTESIAATGRVEGVAETEVSSAVPGRVRRLLVAEGERVGADAPLAILDNSVEAAGVAAARTALLTAQAQLRQASAPTRRTELRRTRAEAEQAERVAAARLAAAEHRLADLERGPTAEQIQAAEAALSAAEYRAGAATAATEQARARLAQAERDVRRQTTLAADGAVAQADADRAQTARDEARTALKAAEESGSAAEYARREAAARLAELRAGTRKETLDVARAEVEAARATLRGAQRIGSAQVDTAVIGPREEDIAVARARVVEAQRALDTARARLADTIVRAPTAGMVSRILAYPGSPVGGAAPLLRFVPSSPLEIVVDVDETYLGRLRPGLEAVVTSDAFPGKRSAGRVTRIGAQVDRDRGTVEVRVIPAEPADWLRPGQTVSVNIIVWQDRPMLTVPLTAIANSGLASVAGLSARLYVLEEGVARERQVRMGAPGAVRVPIIEGISKTDQVVVNAAAVKPGQRGVASPARSGQSR